MPRMTKARKRAMNRRADGTFGPWTGGRTKRQLKKKRQSFQGISIHIGAEFKRQRGRKARVGDTVRTKRKDGGYHKGAYWYIHTDHGWRVSPTQTRKPGATTIRGVREASRPGRRHVKTPRRV